MPHYTIAEFHGAITHFPVAMLIAAMLFDVGAPLFRKPEWRIVSFWLLVTAVVGAVPSLISGWLTGNQFFGNVPNPPDVFTRHRLAAFVTSGLALVLLAWRISAKDRLTGTPLALSVALAVVVGIGVSYTGYLGGLMTMGESEPASPTAPITNPANTSMSMPGTKTNLVASVNPATIEKGKEVYSTSGCANCHRLNGQGGNGGPDLSREGDRNANVQWQVAHLKDPAKVHPGSFMPAYNKLSNADLNALAEYLASLK